MIDIKNKVKEVLNLNQLDDLINNVDSVETLLDYKRRLTSYFLVQPELMKELMFTTTVFKIYATSMTVATVGIAMYLFGIQLGLVFMVLGLSSILIIGEKIKDRLRKAIINHELMKKYIAEDGLDYKFNKGVTIYSPDGVRVLKSNGWSIDGDKFIKGDSYVSIDDCWEENRCLSC